jgi:hypothetical protein
MLLFQTPNVGDFLIEKYLPTCYEYLMLKIFHLKDKDHTRSIWKSFTQQVKLVHYT